MYLRNVVLAALLIAGAGRAQIPSTQIAVDAPYQVRYAVNLTTEAGANAGLDAYVNITNDGLQGALRFGNDIEYIPSTGTICANVYVFDNQEEMVWCCACAVTPDETIGFSLQKDILSNPLTRAQTGSVTIKLVATAVVDSGGCPQSAALQNTPTLVGGMLAWGTSPHLINQGASQTAYFQTETPFLPAQLSAGEEASLATKCALILGNGTGVGTCKSCETDALGASKLAN